MDKKQFKIEIGVRARVRRQQLGLSAPELASQMGCSSQTVTDSEAGRKSYSMYFALKWARCMKIGVHELLTGERDEYSRGYAAAMTGVSEQIERLSLVKRKIY